MIINTFWGAPTEGEEVHGVITNRHLTVEWPLPKAERDQITKPNELESKPRKPRALTSSPEETGVPKKRSHTFACSAFFTRQLPLKFPPGSVLRVLMGDQPFQWAAGCHPDRFSVFTAPTAGSSSVERLSPDSESKSCSLNRNPCLF